MTAFDVVLRSDAGQYRNLRVAAADRNQALEQAALDGWQVLGCEPSRSQPAAARRRRRTAFDVAAFAHELASLLAAGLSVTHALQTLAQSAGAGALGRELTAVGQAIAEGIPLSAALERQGETFPPLLIATVRASEMTGDLSESLLRYAGHQQRLRALRDKVLGAAIYPLLLLALGALVVLFLLGVVVPKFAALIEVTRHELPWSSRLLMGWGRLVSEHPGGAAVAALGLGIALVTGLRHLVVDGARSRWIESLPVVGRIVREFRHTQLFHTTGMLLHGGIPLPRALAMCGRLLGSADQARVDEVVRMLRQGRSFSDALQTSGLSDALTAGMVAVAERTGALAEILDRVAQFKEARLQRTIEWASRLIEPALMVFIGLVIGSIVVMMYLPIFDLAASLQ